MGGSYVAYFNVILQSMNIGVGKRWRNFSLPRLQTGTFHTGGKDAEKGLLYASFGI
jgi:hypothetical protein